MKRAKTAVRIILVTLFMLAVMMGMTVAAYADNAYNSYLVTTDDNKTKSGEDLAALQVIFNGKPWYIIADNSTSDTQGTLTLLAADTSFGTSKYDLDCHNNYSYSTVKGLLDSLTTSGSFKNVASAIVSTDNGKLYLLSTEEAAALPEDVLKINFTGGNARNGEWWLRSPIGETGAVKVMGKSGRVDDSGHPTNAAVNMKEEEFKGWSEKIIATGLDNLEAWADELGN